MVIAALVATGILLAAAAVLLRQPSWICPPVTDPCPRGCGCSAKRLAASEEKEIGRAVQEGSGRDRLSTAGFLEVEA